MSEQKGETKKTGSVKPERTLPQTNSFWVPIAIIIAGALVAGAVVFSNKLDNQSANTDLTGTAAEKALP